jgi:hypothetical protein
MGVLERAAEMIREAAKLLQVRALCIGLEIVNEHIVDHRLK